MARADRLLRLLSTIRRLPQPVTAERLAAETEVSERTLYRDIGALRAGGALIDGAPGLGYTLTEDPALPPQMFTRLEIEALVLGLAEVQLAGDPALVLAAQAAQAKIIATLPERVQRQALHVASQIYRFERRPAVPDCLPLLREAIWEERAVAVAYTDRGGQASQRVLWPLSVVFMDRTLMLLAFCTLRQDFRRFRLEALAGVTLTRDSFRPRRVALLRDFVAQLKAGR
ncbi:WYL domain-containing protein [Rhodobacter sp. KR11]|jgi:predicted DNA-binding transcriptional regulator YafY|uniref:helix-turn-helix transcriptional regulator n=1 Tax=Rhodobacter sp. KR11 TaxID=2974588 RepID=UPI0022218B59|nr:WYL domain-containing protein [Rhodobacter sp. KR11]MCW1918237.1 WYL domain-containing protein [Rhodobacter sp. KR11]